MATITGFIERIKFRNEENGYTVMSVTDQSDGEEVIMVGNLAYAAEGDMIEASGHMTQHPVYGEQLQIESYEMKTPQDELSMERYLGSGAIKGIGAALAARIVRHFKADTFRVMEEEPDRTVSRFPIVKLTYKGSSLIHLLIHLVALLEKVLRYR